MIIRNSIFRFAESHIPTVILMILSPFLGIALCLLYKGYWVKGIFADYPETARIIGIEHYGGIFNFMPLALLLTVIYIATFIVVLIIEPIYYRHKVNSSNFKKYEMKIFCKNISIIIYFLIGLLLLTIVSYPDSDMDRGSQEIRDDIDNFKKGQVYTDNGILGISKHPMNTEGYAKVEPKEGIIYLDFQGTDGSEVCLRASDAQIKNLDFENDILYSVTYLEKSKILVDVEPQMKGDFNREFPNLYGFDTYSKFDQKVLKIMLEEGLVELWETIGDEEERVDIELDDVIDSASFSSLNDYYRSYNFEYLSFPYEYSQYAGKSASLIVTRSANFYVLREDMSTRFYAKKYTKNYEDTLDAIIATMPKMDKDYDKINYLVSFMINHTEPLVAEDLKKVDEEENLFLCMSGYGAILSHEGNNWAYNQALYGLLKRAGVDVLPIISSETHYQMLMVKLDDKWYYLDAYAADVYSRDDCLLFGSDAVEGLYGVEGKDYFKFKYGYTDIDAPEVAAESLAIEPERIQASSKFVSITDVLDQLGQPMEPDKDKLSYPIKAKSQEDIEDWIEEMFVHVQTFDVDSQEHVEFSYGEDGNDMAVAMFQYLAIKNSPEYDISNIDVHITGYTGTKNIILAQDYLNNYKSYTGLSDEAINNDGRVFLPDQTGEYYYFKKAEMLSKISEKEFVNLGGNPSPNNISLSNFRYPAKARVEQVTESANGYNVVFYTSYTGYGEHYFTMELEKTEDGSYRIKSLTKRYK